MGRHYEAVRLIYSGNPNMRKGELERDDREPILGVLDLIGETVDPRKCTARELIAVLEEIMDEVD